MIRFPLDARVSGADQPTAADVAALAADGVGLLVDLREKDEPQPDVAGAAAAAQVDYEAIPISGSGTYEVGTIDGEWFHQLVLDLQFGDDPEAPIQTFDSGLVPGGESGEFPDIDISIDEYDLQCLDTLIHVVAGPRPVKIDAAERLERCTGRAVR